MHESDPQRNIIWWSQWIQRLSCMKDDFEAPVYHVQQAKISNKKILNRYNGAL
jgi:hypothetical protein